jgi:hypothetical protein
VLVGGEYSRLLFSVAISPLLGTHGITNWESW